MGQSLIGFNSKVSGTKFIDFVSKKLMSSAVQAPYLIISRAVCILPSAGACDHCLIFSLSMTTVVTLCQSAFPITDSCQITDIFDFNCVPTSPVYRADSKTGGNWAIQMQNRHHS